MLVAVPCVIIGGPLFSVLAARWVDVPVPELFLGPGQTGASGQTEASGTQMTEPVAAAGSARQPADPRTGTQQPAGRTGGTGPGVPGQRDGIRRPSFPVTLGTVLLPVVLMLAKAIADVVDQHGDDVLKRVLDFIGTPLIALLLAVLVAMYTLGVAAGFDRSRLSETVDAALPPIAGILLIVAAGGGLKQVLVDSGISKVIASWVQGSTLSPLLLAWFVAVLIRLATGSATVATVTTAGILQPVTATLSTSHVSLLVLAIGAGSLFFSHVNDAGFWLTKQYFGLSVSQNIKSWSLMETVLSITGIAVVLALSVVV